MHYTNTGSSSIKRAGMDGSSPTTLVSGLNTPWGIAIDFKTSRIFWAHHIAHKIESSNLEGRDREVVVQLPSDVCPSGMAVANGSIYWGEQISKKLQSSTMDGNDVITLHTDAHYLWGITLVPDLYLPQNRTNHCARHSCSKVCALTRNSSRCLT